MASGNRGQRESKHHSSFTSRESGQAATSRGDYSSGKSAFFDASVPSAPRALRDTTNHFKSFSSSYKGRKYDPNFKRKRSQDQSVQPPSGGAVDIFERDRLENAAKRTKRETNNTVNGRGRGFATGPFGNKPARHKDLKSGRSSKSPTPEYSNTAVQKSAMANHPLNPFARKQDPSTIFASPSQVSTRSPSPAASLFGAQSQLMPISTKPGAQSSPSFFGAPSQSGSLNSSGMFGAPSGSASTQNPFGNSLLTSAPVNPFGTSPQPAFANPVFHNTSNHFGANSQQASSNPSSTNAFYSGSSETSTGQNAFGGLSSSAATQRAGLFNPTAKSSAISLSGGSSNAVNNSFAKPSASGHPANPALPPSTSAAKSVTSPAGIEPDNRAARAARFGTNTTTSTSIGGQNKNGNMAAKRIPSAQISKTAFQHPGTKSTLHTDNATRSSESLARKVNDVLQNERIHAPKWPGWDMTDSRPVGQHARVKKHWEDYRAYQSKVRSALIRANLIDDPDVPKKLSEAIDFKGTCEDMCPEYERVDRIMSGRVDDAEKEISPDGTVSRYPSPEKMVKALARSAAGQEAPLPDEVRSAAALRRTVDYLFGIVLADSDLPAVYTFLWDRTRAIRRDFVFHSFMNKSELHDQVDCLEKIVRFHVTAAHQMSRDGVDTQGFSEQQELEQLGKSLLSLIHAYEDCRAQGIVCGNETEFKAYYILWGARSNPGILDEVQNWGWDLWEHEETQLAVSLVETLQTPWDTLPLKPRAETDIAHNAFSRFFSTIEDKSVSYTMACFAETFFNHVRFSFLRTIVKSYRRQKQQSMDWTIPKLNEYLRFDKEEHVIPFCESYGLNFEATTEDIEYLSFKLVGEVQQPSPPLKQGYSDNIVERKRGQHSLTDAIYGPLHEKSSEAPEFLQATSMEEEEDSLFVEDTSSTTKLRALSTGDKQQNLPDQATVGYDWKPSAHKGLEERVLPAVENVAQTTSVFDRIPGPKQFGDIFGAATTSSQSTTHSNSTIFQSQISSEPTSLFAKQPDKTLFPATSSSATTQISEETPVSKPASTFSFLQQPVSSQAIGNSETQSTEVAALNELPKAPAFFQQAPAVASPLPHVEPNIEKHGGFYGSQISSTTAQPSPLTGFVTPNPTGSSSQPLGQTSALSSIATAPIGSKQDDILTTSKAVPPVRDRSSKLTAISEWVALGTDGLMDQFIESQVELILHETAKMFMEEESARIAQEADERAAIKADTFRHRRLAEKYARLWRENVRLMGLKRRGRVARQARRDLAESMRASKAAKSASLVEDFRASTTNRHTESLASLLDDTGVMDGVFDSNGAINTIVHQYGSSPKRQRSVRTTSSVTSMNKKHRRGQSEQQNPLRRSLLSDPTYLHGGSRIHLISNYDAKKESWPQVSGVATDYFRLKARGITTLPDGTPLAKSMTSHTIRNKPSLDEFVKPLTPRHPAVAVEARSVPVKRSKGFANSHEEIQILKAKAKNSMAEEQLLRQKRVYVDDDEELFERAKRVREQMDEGASWYRKEIERGTASRSVS